MKADSRSERYQRAVMLKAKGLTYREIGLAMGISRQRAQQLTMPPKYVYKELRHRAGGKCERCQQEIERGRVGHRQYGDDPWELDDLLYLCLECQRRELGLVQEEVKCS